MKRSRFDMCSSHAGTGLYRGRGGFFGGLAGLLSGKGYDAGSKMGDEIYEKVGKYGDQLGKDFGSMFGGKGLYRGRGDYAANNLVMDGGATASSVVPQFNPSDLHEITYSNREYVRDVFAPAGTVPFSIQSWNLNPGLAASFPWLSQLAINFEEYELLQLCYTYKSTVADFASASGQVGQVVMATQYNPSSDPFADKEEMMLYEGGMSCKTTESLIHGVECDPAKLSGAAQKYVRAGSLPPSEDIKNYDLGRTSLAILNAPSTYSGQQIGELWVSYTVRLRKPKLASLNAYNVQRDLFAMKPNTVVSGLFANPANVLTGARNSLGCQLLTVTGSVPLPTGIGTDDLTSDSSTVGTSTAPIVFALQFPSSYSGVVQIRVLGFNSTSGQSSGAVWQLTSMAPSTILRFKDLTCVTVGTSALTYRHQITTYDDLGSFPQAQRSETEVVYHLRILPPINGLNNIIYFALNNALTAGHAWSVPFVEVTQINSFLNVQDNGSNDRISWVDFAGQPALWA